MNRQMSLFDDEYTSPGDDGAESNGTPFDQAHGGPPVWTVSSLTAYIKDCFESDRLLQDVWLEGEVSNCKQWPSGHVYFTLKDEGSSISCVIWRSAARLMPVLPADGQAVLLHGRISVYELRGTYQLYVDQVQPAGLGLLHARFEALKAQLSEEGLFDAAHKRPLPPFPRRIGVVTSPRGAALRDILNVLRRRYPLVEIVLAPTLVQGEQAPPQIVEAIERLNLLGDLDLIVVARGGGSLEDLWAFNDEDVARAIFASTTPVVSGVGHETDFTIADFVADRRAPTPSAAAEIAVPDQAQLKAELADYKRRLGMAAFRRLHDKRQALSSSRQALERRSPLRQIDRHRQRIDEHGQSMARSLAHRLALLRERMAGLQARLAALSPLATLERGYAIVRHADSDIVITSVDEVSPGEALAIQLRDGHFAATAGER
jgi:exodeoxyribonuclease VII large subunit